jgi:hypothetical protein
VTEFRTFRIGSRALRTGSSIGPFGRGRRGPHSRQWIIRPKDLVVLDIALDGMKVVPGVGGETAQLGPDGPGPRYLILTFPPQHMAEEAYFTTVAEYPLTLPPSKDEPEGAGDDAGKGDDPLGAIPIDVRLAGWSTLVFNVRDEQLPIEWTLEELLRAVPHLELSVAPNALPPSDPPALILPFVDEAIQEIQVAPSVLGATSSSAVSIRGAARELTRARTIGHVLGLSIASGSDTLAILDEGVGGTFKLGPSLFRPEPRPPSAHETALELPHRLILSPNRHGAWFHSATVVHSDVSDRTELWHTRLGVRQEIGRLVDGPDPLRTVRAIWATDLPDPPTPAYGEPADPPTLLPPPDPFRTSLDGADRYNIVHLTSNFRLRRPVFEDQYYEPQAVKVDHLALSALGGWLDSRGVWDEQPLNLEIEEWRHRATLGRDHYVRVVYPGRLFPLGHRASLVKITERRFERKLPGHPAYLRQMMFLIPREPLRFYGESGLTYKGPDSKRLGEQWDLQLPFRAARILNRVSPLLDPPGATEIVAGLARRAFWPYVKGQPFCFNIVATDWTGQPVDLAMPLAFIGQRESDQPYEKSIIPDDLVNDYAQREWPDSSRLLATVPLGGQKVAFAESADPDDTTFAVDTLTFAGAVPVAEDFKKIHPRVKPRYVPVVADMDLVVPAIQQLAQTDQPATLAYHSRYLKDGFGGSNSGQVFLAAAAAPLTIPFSSRSNRSGGLVAPEMALSGLSRSIGPVSGNIDVASTGSFSPSTWFGLDEARLFGALSLSTIIGGSTFDKLDELPRFVGDSLNQVQRAIADLERLQRLLAADDLPEAAAVETTLTQLLTPETGEFAQLLTGASATNVSSTLGTLGDALDPLQGAIKASTKLKAGPKAVLDEAIGSLVTSLGALDQELLFDVSQGKLLPESFAARFDWRPITTETSIFKPHGNRNLILSVAASGDDLTVTCSLDEFDLDLAYLLLEFRRVQFRVRAGQKPEVDVDFKGFTFVGPLSFIEVLRTLIPLDGFADPPDVDVTPEGITAGFSTALPNIAVGVFSLENLSLAAGFSVPFVGPPMTTWFRFCERENPARLTVSLFGGGFFFGVTVDAAGLQVVEGAFEFGAAVSVNFGVASGSVSAMAGLYFKIEGPKVTLAGYFRLRGEVEALGVVSVSIELYLEMRYEDGGGASGKCVGTATISVEVEVALWSTTIKLTCTKKFAGSGEGADPTLADTLHLTAGMTSPDWTEYCEAFAA